MSGVRARSNPVGPACGTDPHVERPGVAPGLGEAPTSGRRILPRSAHLPDAPSTGLDARPARLFSSCRATDGPGVTRRILPAVRRPPDSPEPASTALLT